MPWPRCYRNVVEVEFCRTKCNKMAVIHQGYYFHHNRKYKGGDYWNCANRGCKVRLVSSRVNHETGRMEFSRCNNAILHTHDPNTPNLVGKEFRRQLVAQFYQVTAGEMVETSQQATAAAVRLVYDQLRRQAVERGIPEFLIPPLEIALRTVHRIRRKREPTQSLNNSNPDIRENNANSAVEGSNLSRSGSSGSSTEFPTSSGDSSTSPEQTEPLCLVTRKNNALTEPQRGSLGSLQHTSPILYQTLQSPNSCDSTLDFQLPPMQYEPATPPFDQNVLRYSSTFPLNN